MFPNNVLSLLCLSYYSFAILAFTLIDIEKSIVTLQLFFITDVLCHVKQNPVTMARFFYSFSFKIDERATPLDTAELRIEIIREIHNRASWNPLLTVRFECNSSQPLKHKWKSAELAGSSLEGRFQCGRAALLYGEAATTSSRSFDTIILAVSRR